MPNEAATGLEEPLLSVLWYYDVVYWSGSQGTHASPIAVETYLSTSSTGQPSYKLGLSVARARARSTVSPTERDGSLLERRPAPAPGARGFERRRRPEHGEVGEAAADDLQAHREAGRREPGRDRGGRLAREVERVAERGPAEPVPSVLRPAGRVEPADGKRGDRGRRGQRSEEHTSELQSRLHLVCRLLLEKKKKSQEPHHAD